MELRSGSDPIKRQKDYIRSILERAMHLKDSEEYIKCLTKSMQLAYKYLPFIGLHADDNDKLALENFLHGVQTVLDRADDDDKSELENVYAIFKLKMQEENL